MYEKGYENKIDESIDLLIQSSKLYFSPSEMLLCLALIKKHGPNLKNIEDYLEKSTNESNDLAIRICKMIKDKRLCENSIFEKLWRQYKSIDYLYEFNDNIYFQSNKLNRFKSKSDNHANSKIKDISSLFYEGFNIE